MSYNYIRQLARKATVKASKGHVEPKVLCSADLEEGIHGIPFIGDYVADGWELEKVYFVDSSGFGAPNETALTFVQFVDAIRPHVLSDVTYGYGLMETGQFQVYIGEYRRQP